MTAYTSTTIISTKEVTLKTNVMKSMKNSCIDNVSGQLECLKISDDIEQLQHQQLQEKDVENINENIVIQNIIKVRDYSLEVLNHLALNNIISKRPASGCKGWLEIVKDVKVFQNNIKKVCSINNIVEKYPLSCGQIIIALSRDLPQILLCVADCINSNHIGELFV